MTDIYALAALWLGLALAATLLSIWLRIATARSSSGRSRNWRWGRLLAVRCDHIVLGTEADRSSPGG
jgi:hypothetical protein